MRNLAYTTLCFNYYSFHIRYIDNWLALSYELDQNFFNVKKRKSSSRGKFFSNVIKLDFSRSTIKPSNPTPHLIQVSN